MKGTIPKHRQDTISDYLDDLFSVICSSCNGKCKYIREKKIWGTNPNCWYHFINIAAIMSDKWHEKHDSLMQE